MTQNFFTAAEPPRGKNAPPESSKPRGQGVVGVLPPTQPAHIIRSESEALDVARALAADFAAGAAARDRDRVLPWNEIERYSQSGLWGITVPREYGGAQVSSGVLARVVSILSAADGNFGHIPQNHYYALEVLRVGGTDEQKRFFYERVLHGERLGNALAEIGHKDFKRRTQFTRHADGTGGVVDGRKFYCTGAIYAHWIPTMVAAQEDGEENIYLIFVPRSAPGVTVTDDWDGFGQRVTGSGSVQFDQVQVQPRWVLPFKALFDTPTTIGPFAQIIHAAIDAGIGHGALAATLPFVREHARPWVDANIARAADDPLLLHQLGHVHVRLRAADALIARAGRFVDAAQRESNADTVAQASVAVAQAKAQATEASLLAANKLFELSGTGATLGGLQLDRFWRNARTHTLHDPVRWKYHAIGNYALNGQRPPRHGAI